ncbi:MAG: hypothetical protein NWS22_10605 [Porticoccaceae bacterium]|jgi:hypothetical protein|nr:MAG: hypothetical protein ABS23_02395 [SAR92 bacterium BACL16 MAG-120619-bin48]MDP4654053.1 hypothetical protein [Alphaproteobacteria bacterium]MDP4745277.1 hypothetical protein [Porticoccaceae bacterium]MDP4751970.1 hypothetical protein [Porticoccaceae bacterium]MDP4890965.1 hypothetical protein [Porticoccaceae bacterium]
MFSAEDYLYGWIAYIAGGVCLLIVLGYLLRKARAAWVRHVPVLVSAAILVTPVTAYPDDKHLAPAFFVSLYEGLLASGDDLGFQRGLAPILAVLMFVLILYILLRVVGSFFRSRQTS